MKSVSRLSIFGILILLTISCSQSPEEPANKKALEMLSFSTWRLGSVNVDGVDRTELFEGMTIKFSESTYTSDHGGTIWKSNGTWAFSDDKASAILLDDVLTVSIEELNDNNLILSLVWTKNTLGGGRLSSISGNHVFVFGH